MITGEIRSKVDRIWDAFASGGIVNPLTVIEQITYLLFIKRIDEIHTTKELKANMTKTEIEDPIFTKKNERFRWSRFKDMEAGEMYNIVSSEVFHFIKKLNGNENSA